jgi:hypothetical protein
VETYTHNVNATVSFCEKDKQKKQKQQKPKQFKANHFDVVKVNIFNYL